MPVLDAILDDARAALPGLRARRRELERTAIRCAVPPDFAAAFQGPGVGLLAEVKRRSPSAGPINQGLDPVDLACLYTEGGAAAISVLTNLQFFGGSLADLSAVAGAVDQPVLRKDFILDETQLLEARVAGASAALLIARILPGPLLKRALDFAMSLGLTPLVETHSQVEIDRALNAGARVIGVNARDLDTLAVDTVAAWRLLASIPADCLAIAESGMATRDDVVRAAAAGADAVLVGSALSGAPDPASRTRELSGVARHAR